ncbi:MAG TPA: sigma-70 family RNA polymerase sigma factor [Thermomicrobiales bacterium]
MARTVVPPTQVDEATLIARATRDRAAFAPLYERYSDPIFRHCYRRLGNRADAEDATILVFQRALANLKSFNGDSLRPWLFTIANNVIADHYRNRWPTASLDAAFDVHDPAPDPETTAVQADRRRSLQTYLCQLPPDQQRAIELRLAGMTGPEIAAVLDCPHEPVRALLLRATKRLRTLFGIAPGSTEDGDD